ncbi:hypothetical protein LTR56_003967 [Elasticomyces elasticus]|nr:hypothetical protein LTR56_003967 [Elasticomyces elasticus]KAK3661044.1 hypothetical protein LTR22_007670 [Elasticomyces elasticus]KAK4921052.1 hypothetical protein LTR49_011422 [Elasticomyces elasticus]KAK5752985.1 hypothetical protein LTS12_016956 [Elasticomyces elasticus]
MSATEDVPVARQDTLDVKKQKAEAVSCVAARENSEIASALPPHLRAAQAKLASKRNKTIAGVEKPRVQIIPEHDTKTVTATARFVGNAQTSDKLTSPGLNTAEKAIKVKGFVEPSVPTWRPTKLTIVEDDAVRRAAQRAVRAGAAAPIRTASDVWVKVDYKVDTASEEQEWDMLDEFRIKSTHKE